MKNIETCKEKNMLEDVKNKEEKLKKKNQEKIIKILQLSPLPFPGN